MTTRKPASTSKGLVPSPATTRSLSVVQIDLQSLIRDWLASLKPNTRRAYERAMMDFAGFLKVAGSQEAAAVLFSMSQGDANATVFQYRNALTKGGLQASSVNLKISAVLAMNKIGRMAGFVPWTIDVPLLKVESYRDTRGTGADVVEPALAKLEKEGLDTEQGVFSARDLAVLTLIYRQGLRRGEVASLDTEHLELEKGKFWILGKSRSAREEITLTPRTVGALRRWLSVRPGAPGALFPSLDRGHAGKRLTGGSIWRIVKSYSLGRPHGIRHTSISEVLIRTNGNLLAAQQFGRHRDPKVTVRYWDKIKDVGGDAAKLLDKDADEKKE
jgi:integrase/recombinase XerC